MAWEQSFSPHLCTAISPHPQFIATHICIMRFNEKTSHKSWRELPVKPFSIMNAIFHARTRSILLKINAVILVWIHYKNVFREAKLLSCILSKGTNRALLNQDNATSWHKNLCQAFYACGCSTDRTWNQKNDINK